MVARWKPSDVVVPALKGKQSGSVNLSGTVALWYRPSSDPWRTFKVMLCKQEVWCCVQFLSGFFSWSECCGFVHADLSKLLSTASSTAGHQRPLSSLRFFLERCLITRFSAFFSPRSFFWQHANQKLLFPFVLRINATHLGDSVSTKSLLLLVKKELETLYVFT